MEKPKDGDSAHTHDPEFRRGRVEEKPVLDVKIRIKKLFILKLFYIKA